MKKGLCVVATVVALVALVVSPAPAKLVSGAGAADRGECDGRLGAGHARVRPGYEELDMGTVTRAQQRAMERRFRQALRKADIDARPGTTIRVPVRFHVIRTDNAAGGVTDAQIAAQLRVLNQAFRGDSSPVAAQTPFRFRLRSVDRTNNSDWYNWTLRDDDRPAKRALHQGGPRTLNLYTANLGDRLLGYAYFPVPIPTYVDGVVLLNESLPGGSAAPFNLGDTATHEVGHWLNLYHTFQNACHTPGDRVDDTPYQDDEENIFSCNRALDSCPVRRGNDPVHNFMSYGNDRCLDRFTAGQATRMTNAWNALRN